jgi:hypothetical protein
MEGIREVEQLDDTHLRWAAEIAGQVREWEAKITEQHPDERVAWTNTSGATNAGVVTFHRLGPGKSRIMLQLEFEPEGTKGGSATLWGSCERARSAICVGSRTSSRSAGRKPAHGAARSSSVGRDHGLTGRRQADVWHLVVAETSHVRPVASRPEAGGASPAPSSPARQEQHCAGRRRAAAGGDVMEDPYLAKTIRTTRLERLCVYHVASPARLVQRGN